MKNLPGLIVAAFMLVACSGSGPANTPQAATPTAVASTMPGTLALTAAMTTPRFCHTATLLNDGRVLITGGLVHEQQYLGSAELYDPQTNQFMPAGRMIEARACHTATRLPDGRVLLVGGLGTGNDYLASAELYDPATDTFTATGSLLAGRNSQRAVLLNAGYVLVAGGLGEGWSFLDSAERYDPATGLFTEASQMSTPRVAFTMTLLQDGTVLVAGGDAGRRTNMKVFDSAEIYDPVTGTFSSTGVMTLPRHKHAAALLPDGNVLVVGGADVTDWEGQYDAAEIYDSTLGLFTATEPMAIPHFKLTDAITPLANGNILVAGGGLWAETYNPLTQLFDIVGTLDAPRFYATTTLLNDGRVLITGGYDPNIVTTANAWVYVP